MARFLLTQSLLSSWLWAQELGAQNPEKWDEFYAALRREEKPDTEAMAYGRAFEALVTDVLNGRAEPDAVWYKAASQIADEIRGAQLQVKIYREIAVDGMDFLLYGVLDALLAGVVYDIKYTKHYDVGKYYDSPQHPMYFYLCPEAHTFVYLPSDGETVRHERYYREDVTPIEHTIREFMGFLTHAGLMDTYKQFWRARES